MMPELGKYAFAVLASYGVTALAFLGLALVSLRRAAQARRQVAVLDADRERRHG